jgi:hypothetical protein
MANRYSNTRVTSRTIRFYDQSMSAVNQINIEESMTLEQKAYLGLRDKAFSSNNKVVNVTPASPGVSASLDWESTLMATPPAGFPALIKTDFTLFINGVVVEPDAIDSITQVGNNVEVILNSGLDYIIESSDEYTITGKFA